LKHSKAKKQPTSTPRPPDTQAQPRLKGTRKEVSPEYRLLIAPHFDERKQRYTTRVALETVKTFASFRYDLTVKEQIDDGTISYTIVGLNAPQLSLPGAGTARYSKEYDGLSGSYHVSVKGLDGKVSTVDVRVRPTDVKIIKPPAGRLIDVVTDERLWESE